MVCVCRDEALCATKNSGLQSALDWIEAHPDGESDKGKEKMDDIDNKKGESLFDQPSQVEDDTALEGFRKVLKCNSCDTTFSSAELAQLHATKTGHDDFSESLAKQLTEEEKAVKLQQLKTKLAEKKAMEAEAEKEQNLENERIRRKAGKENEDAKREREKKNLEKIRQDHQREQEEARKSKERILAMIEEDKRERERKFAKHSEEDVSKEPVDLQPAAMRPQTPTDSARIQVKLPDGRALKYNMKATDTFLDLVDRIATDYPDIDGHTLFMSPERRQLNSIDHKVTLAALGMSPSATLMMQ